MTATITPAANLEESYRRARQRGLDHRDATQRAEHAHGGGRRPSELASRIDRARAAWDREHGELKPASIQVGDPGEPEDEPDSFSAAEHELRQRKAELEAERQRLSLDSLTDNRARAEVAKVEKELDEVETALTRRQLARAEKSSREQTEQKASEQKIIEDALKLADELGIERAKAARATDRAARQLGEALARLNGACMAQGEALRRAGRIDVATGNLPDETTLQGMLGHWLAVTGAPDQWAPSVLPRFQRPIA